jgi:epoxyqueuosine reductase QueG
MDLEQHPTVLWYYEQETAGKLPYRPHLLHAEELHALCVEAGADDAGFVRFEHPALDLDRSDLQRAFPSATSVIALAFRLQRENLRSVLHSCADLEFRQALDRANRAARTVADRLLARDVGVLRIPAGFPFETDRWPGKMWPTSDKLIAEAAGLGKMGWNRCVLHPRFGSAVALATLLLDTPLDTYGSPLSFNPCIECKLCVSVCPVGAIAPDGRFDFLSCFTHNYRERLGGFQDWVEQVVSSGSVADYRKRVRDSETVSMWQNLSIGPQTRCDRCLAVCPAGEEAIGQYLPDVHAYHQRVVDPLKHKEEPVYVVPGSDAESYVYLHDTGKTIRRVSNGIRARSAASFLQALPLIFQRGQSEGLNATYHFTFTGEEEARATVVIQQKTIRVLEGHVGTPDIAVTADARTWVEFLAKERSLPMALGTRRIKVKGSPRLLQAFARCFPS